MRAPLARAEPVHSEHNVLGWSEFGRRAVHEIGVRGGQSSCLERIQDQQCDELLRILLTAIGNCNRDYDPCV